MEQHWAVPESRLRSMEETIRTLAAALTNARQPEPETGWLIEFSQRVSGTPTYYGKSDEGLGQTEDNLAAIRYARKEDAEAVIEDIGWTEAAAVEHQWCDPVTSTPSP